MQRLVNTNPRESANEALASILAQTRESAGARAVLDALPAAIYLTDAQGKITYYNDAAAALWGCRPEVGKDEWCGSWKLYWPDGTPMAHDECPMAVTIREGRPIRGVEAIAERPDGTRVPFAPYPTPLFGSNGELIGAVNMLIDLSDRKADERSTAHFAAIVESSDDAIISKNLDGTIVSWNKGAERLFGYTADEIVGKPIMVLIPDDRIDEEPGILARLSRGERIDHYETVRKKKDGSLIDISITVSPVRTNDGRIVGASKIARDISERRRAQAHERLLLNEMKHRIKNNLATVQAIASQTIKSATPDERNAFNGRLQALGRAHDLLTMENWNRASLREVVRDALHPFQESHRTRLFVEGPSDIWLNASKSALLAMGLHELATNAVKYGALSNGTGQVRVHWERMEEGEAKGVRLRWQESGGPEVRTPEKKGFGSLLVERAMKGELGDASIDYAPSGVVCTVDIAL